VPFEWLTAYPLSAEQWAELAGRMGWQALRMNLNTLARNGAFGAEGLTDQVAARLADRDALRAVRPMTAERVAKKAVGRMLGFLESDAFAGPYLADQLLLPFALAGGGSFTTVKPSQHSLTAIDVIGRFLNQRLGFAQQAGGTHLLTVR
jgi:RNA 3'-terminal phosphate cyclase